MTDPTDADLTADQIAEITRYADIDAPPPDDTAAAYLLFGTNQPIPATLAAERHHRGLAPLVIVTGGINRHNGIIEGREFHRLLTTAGVPDEAIRVEDTSADTWQNIQNALPHLHEALDRGLPLVAVSKWYHRRAIHVLRTLLPDAAPFYALGWEPLYSGTPITRDNWPTHPDGRRRVIREWQETHRRIDDGSLQPLTKVDGAWQ